MKKAYKITDGNETRYYEVAELKWRIELGSTYNTPREKAIAEFMKVVPTAKKENITVSLSTVKSEHLTKF